MPTDSFPPTRQAAPAPTLPSRSFSTNARKLRYPLLVAVVVIFVTLGQMVEDSLDTPRLEMFGSGSALPRWTLSLLTLYMLVMLRWSQKTAVKSLREVRVAVQVDDATFETIRERMARTKWRTAVGLGVIAFVFVMLLFNVFGSPLPIVRNPETNALTFLPRDALSAAIVLVAYWLVGWIALSLMVRTVRLGYALGDLTRLPLRIDLFDTDNVVPLGRLALVLSLAPAGVFLILLFGLGMPTGPLSWLAFFLASLSSLLALILPLRGVHRQMDHAKRAALSDIHHELGEIHRELMPDTGTDATRTGVLSNRTATLVNLRKVLQEVPTWPFRDTLAVSRAILLAAAPLIYALLNELIRIFLIAPLTK